MEISQFSDKYFNAFRQALNTVESDYKGDMLDHAGAIVKSVELILQVQEQNKKVMMLGNGGSAGITSHMAVDYWKNGNIRATAFNDASLLTCISNDFSYEEVFAKPIEAFADKGDIVLCISSSGSSVNILNAAIQARKSGCTVLTFSGFKQDNPLRQLGDLNFYVQSHAYGFVELIHNFLIHEILDAKLYCHDRKDIFNKNIPY